MSPTFLFPGTTPELGARCTGPWSAPANHEVRPERMGTNSKHHREDTVHRIFRFVFVQPFLMTSVHPKVNIKANTSAWCLPHPKPLPPCSLPLLHTSLCLLPPHPHTANGSNHLVSDSGPRCPWRQTEEPHTGTAQGTLRPRSTCTTDTCVCKQTGPNTILIHEHAHMCVFIHITLRM